MIIRAHTHHLYLPTRSNIVCDSDDVIRAALDKDATARRIMAKQSKLIEGMRIGGRLNINVERHTGVAVYSLHEGKLSDGYHSNKGWWSGSVLAYAPFIVLKNAYFNVGQSQRNKIALGESSKEPMASVDGNLLLTGEPSFAGIEVGFNPKRSHLFVDREGYAIRYADEVTIHRHTAYATGRVEYYTELTAPIKVGAAPSNVLFK